MFERYTEKARRAIFFARHEATQTASQAIEPEHILLGLLREDKLIVRALPADEGKFAELLREDLRTRAGGDVPLPTSADMPLSQQAKLVLTTAANEGARLNQRYIGTELLLLGVIKTAGTFACEALQERGLTAEIVTAYLTRDDPGEDAGGGQEASFSVASSGYRTFDEFFGAMATRAGVRELKEGFRRLLDRLVENGTITQEERDAIERG